MEFQTKAQKAMYEKVREWLGALLAEQVEASPDGPSFGVRNNSAFVQVAVVPMSDEETVVRVFSIAVRGVELEPTLQAWLLAQNREVPMGAFAVSREGDVMFLQNLIGSVCTREQLSAVLQVVATVADQAGTAIVARWGGERAFEDEVSAAAAGDDAPPDDDAEAPDAPPAALAAAVKAAAARPKPQP